MIRFDRVSKQYRTRGGGYRRVLDETSFEIGPGQALGICGHNGAGKSTLLRLIAGVERPSSGTVDRAMSVSWPLGYASSFQSSLTGADNVRFIARVYGRPVDRVLAFVEEFAELGAYLDMPIRTYSAGMNARLAFAASLAVDFDCYLVDEITAAGDERFRARCHAALMERRERGTLIMVSHDPHVLRAYCDTGATLVDGRLTFYDTIDAAMEQHF
ncbi:ABC transporter ATP-binding protein [Sphingomonas sp. ST-64]|uniref:ABC transporter ATP-binding protein n=1 Tax=Sphingomonas plantiphila TaxID=3163295 RepID=A0ABW8YL45_9SPHN